MFEWFSFCADAGSPQILVAALTIWQHVLWYLQLNWLLLSFYKCDIFTLLIIAINIFCGQHNKTLQIEGTVNTYKCSLHVASFELCENWVLFLDIHFLKRKLILNFLVTHFFCFYLLYWFLSSCSSSSADLRRNAALSLYPVISCLTAVISAGLSLCVNKGLFFILKSVGPGKQYDNNNVTTTFTLLKFFFLTRPKN